MKYFLLVFDRQKGQLIDAVEEYSEDQAQEALAARFSREQIERSNLNVEVVVLGAADRGDLETTHSRYFGEMKELTAS